MDKIEQLLSQYREEMMETVQKWVRIPSVKGEAAPGAKKPGLLVYAGPEFFRRKAEKDISALASGVYAGPEPPREGMMGAAPDDPADGEA